MIAQSNYGKILYRLEKPKARTYYLVQEDAEDSWFIHFRSMEIKSNKEKKTEMIIRKDLDQWINWLNGMGWLSIK